MRISSEQIEQFHIVISKFWKDIPYELYLYGSRVHDHLKGGDIDLLILTTQMGIEVFQKSEFELLVAIKKQPAIGQRRIDLKVATFDQLETEPFLQAIGKELVKL